MAKSFMNEERFNKLMERIAIGQTSGARLKRSSRPASPHGKINRKAAGTQRRP